MIKKSKDPLEKEVTLEQEDIPTRATANKVYKNEKQKKAEENKEYVPIISPRQTIEVAVKPRPTRQQLEKIETPKQSHEEDNQEEKIGRIIEKAEKPKRRTKKSKNIIEEKVKPLKIESLSKSSLVFKRGFSTTNSRSSFRTRPTLGPMGIPRETRSSPVTFKSVTLSAISFIRTSDILLCNKVISSGLKAVEGFD